MAGWSQEPVCTQIIAGIMFKRQKNMSKNKEKVWTILSCNEAFYKSQWKVNTESVIVCWKLALHYRHAGEQSSLNLTLHTTCAPKLHCWQ